jgi:hypothetical protein
LFQQERILSSYVAFITKEQKSGGPEMDKRDQELLDKQLRFGGNPPLNQNSVMIGLITVAAFMIGIGIGDILSKSKQANTNYAAMASRIAEALPHPL